MSFIFYLFIYFCGTGNGTQGHATSKLHLQPICILYLKLGLTKLQKPHLVAEAGREPGSSSLSLSNAGITSVRHHARLCFISYLETLDW